MAESITYTLPYKSLQKLCVDRRTQGRLPVSAKCSGSRSGLIKTLTTLPKSPLESYYNVLPSLAPYLTYDKLLLFIAYYPDHPLLKQLRDLNGKVWSDRVWAETGEAPHPLKIGGIRYYSLWATQRYLPWGYLYFQGKTEIRVQQATFDYKDETLAIWAITPDTLAVWAITPRGLEFFRMTADEEDDLYRALNDRDNWKLISMKNFVFISSDVGAPYYTCKALDDQGNLYTYWWDKESCVVEGSVKGVRYAWRPAAYENTDGIYLISSGGTHKYRDSYLSTPLSVTERTLGVGQRPEDFEDPSVNRLFERFVMKTDRKTDNTVWTTGFIRTEAVLVKNEDKTLVPDLLYFLPIEAPVEKIHQVVGTFPLSNTGDSVILGVDGRLYQLPEQPGSLPTVFESNMRFTSYKQDLYGTGMGVVW